MSQMIYHLSTGERSGFEMLRCVLAGVFGDTPLRLHMEQILIRGFAQFDARHAATRVVIPVLIGVLDYTVVPYFLARVACLFIDSYMLRTVVVNGGNPSVSRSCSFLNCFLSRLLGFAGAFFFARVHFHPPPALQHRLRVQLLSYIS